MATNESLKDLLKQHDLIQTGKLQEKCPFCNKLAREKSKSRISTSKGDMLITTLECNHVLFKPVGQYSPFHELVFDGIPTCKHQWGTGKERTICQICNARKLYDFQVTGCQLIEEYNGRFGLFDEQGLGKAIQAAAYLKYHLHDALKYMWVTKSGIKVQHGKELIRILGKEHVPQIFMTSKDRPIPEMSGYIIGYDLFRRLDLNMFDGIGIKSVILDECQALMNPESARTQAVRAVIRDIPKIIPTSGTPWKNRGSEFYVALNALDPVQFYSLQSYKDKWVMEYWDGAKRKEGGIRNPEKFRKACEHIFIRRERKEVMPELPTTNRMKLLCEVPDWARLAYNKEKEKLRRLHDDAVIGGEEGSFENKAKENQILMVMKQIVGIAKVPATVDFAKEFLEETDRKLIIFVHHIECGKQIYEQMKSWMHDEKMGEPLQLVGGSDAFSKSRIQDLFNGNGYRLLIASTLSSGEGLNLQTCSDMVMHERQWNPANEEQPEGRMIRIGQQAEQVNATYMHAEKTADVILDDIVEGKRVSFHLGMNKSDMPAWNPAIAMKDFVTRIINQ